MLLYSDKHTVETGVCTGEESGEQGNREEL